MSDLVLVGVEGNIGLTNGHHGPTGHVQQTVRWLTQDASPVLAHLQPTPAPDGSSIAWTTTGRDSPLPETFLSIHDGATTTRLSQLFGAFFHHWRPDSCAVASLGSGPLGLELTITDRRDRTTTIVARGAPLFFDWAADGALCTHTGQPGTDCVELHLPDGDTLELVDTPGGFTAPQWIDVDRVAVVDGDGLVVLDRRATAQQRVPDSAGMTRFVVSPDGTRVAWCCELGEEADHLVIDALDARGSGRHRILDTVPVAFEWSPTGEHLAALTVGELGGVPWLRWCIWSEPTGLSWFDWFRPSAVYGRDYLPFADQYQRSQTIWSPAADAFTYSGRATDGREGVWVQDLRSMEARRVCDGVMSVWLPGPSVAAKEDEIR